MTSIPETCAPVNAQKLFEVQVDEAVQQMCQTLGVRFNTVLLATVDHILGREHAVRRHKVSPDLSCGGRCCRCGSTQSQHFRRGRASAWGVWWWRQQPPTARGMVFLALEDATGLVNVALYPAVAAASREALTAPFVIVEGQIQYDGQSVGVLGTRVLPVGYPQYVRMED